MANEEKKEVDLTGIEVALDMMGDAFKWGLRTSTAPTIDEEKTVADGLFEIATAINRLARAVEEMPYRAGTTSARSEDED